MDNRATASALGYFLALGIIAVLVAILVAGGGNVIDSKTEVTQHDHLHSQGQILSNELQRVDRMSSRTATDSSLTLSVELHDKSVGVPYDIRIEDTLKENIYDIVLSPQNSQLEVTVKAHISHDVATPTTVKGGDVQITYSTTSGAIEVTGDA